MRAVHRSAIINHALCRRERAEVAVIRRTLLPMLPVPFAVSLLTTALADDTADLKVIVDKMTVLSACETASGRKDPGKEFGLLADGFVEAGSTTINASLWRVSDESTATLMERFYKEPKAGKSKAEAKRQAEIALLEDPKTAHPHFWTPFVLIGDWR